MLKIIKMTLGHIEELMDVEKLCFTIPWSRNAFEEEITKNSAAHYLVALSDTAVVGYGGMWKVLDEGHITNIGVHPAFRKMGIASKLLLGLFEIARQEEIIRMTLEVRKSNIAALKLYEKYGFNCEGIRKAYYADSGEDAIIMWKEKII